MRRLVGCLRRPHTNTLCLAHARADFQLIIFGQHITPNANTFSRSGCVRKSFVQKAVTPPRLNPTVYVHDDANETVATAATTLPWIYAAAPAACRPRSFRRVSCSLYLSLTRSMLVQSFACDDAPKPPSTWRRAPPKPDSHYVHTPLSHYVPRCVERAASFSGQRFVWAPVVCFPFIHSCGTRNSWATNARHC